VKKSHLFNNLVLLGVILLVSACSPFPLRGSGGEVKSEKPRQQTPRSSPDEQAALARDNNAFAYDLYGVLREGDGNLFYSPYSISVALAMTYAGAQGDTASQMAEVMHYTLPQSSLHPAFNALSLNLAASAKQEGEGDPFQLNIANSLWGQQDFSFKSDFLDLLAENYGAGMRTVDFAGDAEGSRQVINRWVSDATKQKIKT
jgi:serpin B